MLEMLRDLVAHKGHANAALLSAVRQNANAAADPDLRELFQHILVANRFWLFTIQGLPFAREEESRPLPSFEALVQRFASTQEQESAWLDSAAEADLARAIEHPRIPGGTCLVWHAWLQVCLHSHGHRAQCATLLRRHGGVPPVLDFILWPASRPQPQWDVR